MPIFFKKLLILVILLLTYYLPVKSEILKKIDVSGNERVSDETIRIFSLLSIDTVINPNLLNEAIQNLYETNFLKMFQ
jgi:outer membrane protein insertion porin family